MAKVEVKASTAAASRSACQFQGSSRPSSWALVRPETMRSSTSVSHARGSTPFNFAVATRLATIAQWRAPPSEPAKRAFLRPKADVGSLCPSSSSIYKHWQLPLRWGAMRTAFAHERGDDCVAVEILDQDLPGRTRHDLLGRQHTVLDQSSDDMAGDAELGGSLAHGEPCTALFRRAEGVHAVNLAD